MVISRNRISWVEILGLENNDNTDYYTKMWLDSVGMYLLIFFFFIQTFFISLKNASTWPKKKLAKYRFKQKNI